jgi:hypothetical protein
VVRRRTQTSRHTWLARKRTPEARTRISVRLASSAILLRRRKGRVGVGVGGDGVVGSMGSPMLLI